MRRILIGVAARLRARKTGLRGLRREVRTCEYEDVQVMWEMLSSGETRFTHQPPARVEGKRHVWRGLCFRFGAARTCEAPSCHGVSREFSS